MTVEKLLVETRTNYWLTYNNFMVYLMQNDNNLYEALKKETPLTVINYLLLMEQK